MRGLLLLVALHGLVQARLSKDDGLKEGGGTLVPRARHVRESDGRDIDIASFEELLNGGLDNAPPPFAIRDIVEPSELPIFRMTRASAGLAMLMYASFIALVYSSSGGTPSTPIGAHVHAFVQFAVNHAPAVMMWTPVSVRHQQRMAAGPPMGDAEHRFLSRRLYASLALMGVYYLVLWTLWRTSVLHDVDPHAVETTEMAWSFVASALFLSFSAAMDALGGAPIDDSE
jgi:hypothetical protein